MNKEEYIKYCLKMDKWWKENVCGTFEPTENCEYMGKITPKEINL